MPTPMERYRKGYERGLAYLQQKREREQQEWQRGMTEKRFGLEEERWETMEPYYEAQTERALRPQALTPYQDWRSRNPDAPVADWYKLQQKTAEPTAHARNLALQEKNRMDYMRLRARFGNRKMFDEGGMFLGSPKDRVDYNRFKLLEEQFGGEAKTDDGMAAIRKEYIKYVADWNKLDPAVRPVTPKMSWEKYAAQFGGGGATPTENIDAEIQRRLDEIEKIKRELAE